MSKKVKVWILVAGLGIFAKKMFAAGYKIGNNVGKIEGFFDAYKPEMADAVHKALAKVDSEEAKEETETTEEETNDEA